MKAIFFPLLFITLTAATASAQVGGNRFLKRVQTREPRLSADPELAEAAAKLEEARKREEAANASAKPEQSGARNDEMERKIAAAVANANAEPSPEAKAQSLRSREGIAAAIGNLTSEGKRRLTAGESAAPATLPPSRTLVAQAKTEPASPAVAPSSAAAASPGVPRPIPLKPVPLANPKLKGNTITIEADSNLFDPNTNIGIFQGNVRVRSPEFYLEADEFEVHMKREVVKDDKAPPTPPEPGSKAVDPKVITSASIPSADPSKTDGADAAAVAPAEQSSVERAIARGRRVIIEKLTETGDVQVGQCKRAVWNGQTHEMLLEIMPQVQRDNNLVIATAESTTMTILESGRFTSDGPTTTQILQGADAKPKSRGGLTSKKP
jgi:lipopolysaccharide export system protein LptA